MPSDYISRSELLEKFTKLKKTAPTLRDIVYLDGVMAVIDGTQPAPVESVVHCKECEYQEYCRQRVIIEGADSVHPITFCSYGERRDGNHEQS